MQTGAIVALCLGALLLGLAGVFFIIWFFFKKGQQEDDAIRQWQQGIMLRVDEVFPSIERLLQEGVRVPAPVAGSESEAESYARHQDAADAALQRELEHSNNIGEAERTDPAERTAPAERTLFSDTLFGGGGGFVS
jgi:hypothetical protein